MSNLNLSHLFRGPHFLISSLLHHQGIGIRLNSLVDTGAQGFLFLNSQIASSVSTALRQPIRKLPYPVQVRGFKDKITSNVTHYIRLHFNIDGRKILNCPFIILDLGSQDCIIGIQWLRRFKIKLDSDRLRLVWPSKYPPSFDPSPPIPTILH